MRRQFLLFAYDHFYPEDGVGQCRGVFPDVDSAKAAAFVWFSVVTTRAGKVEGQRWELPVNDAYQIGEIVGGNLDLRVDGEIHHGPSGRFREDAPKEVRWNDGTVTAAPPMPVDPSGTTVRSPGDTIPATVTADSAAS